MDFVSKSQTEKAILFHQLHHNNEMLLLPNIWDILSAKIIQNLDFKAIATASAAISYSNGLLDGENYPFTQLLTMLKKTVENVNLPVTADIESGYADNINQLEENIKQLILTGIVGVNIEDTNKLTKELYTIEQQCERIKIIRKVADKYNIPLFINARTDVYLNSNLFSSEEERLFETIKRGLAYSNEGANGFYPIAITSADSIKQIVQQIKLPINILAYVDAPPLKTLKELKVARVSIASGLLKVGIEAIINSANKFKELDDYASFLSLNINNDFVKKIIKS